VTKWFCDFCRERPQWRSAMKSARRYSEIPSRDARGSALPSRFAPVARRGMIRNMDAAPRKRRRPFWFWGSIVLVAGGILYPLSFGPMCWMTAQTISPLGPVPQLRRLMIVYWPLGAMLKGSIALPGSAIANPLLEYWILAGVGSNNMVLVPTDPTGEDWISFGDPPILIGGPAISGPPMVGGSAILQSSESLPDSNPIPDQEPH
jgi:hypothetical protein